MGGRAVKKVDDILVCSALVYQEPTRIYTCQELLQSVLDLALYDARLQKVMDALHLQ